MKPVEQPWKTHFTLSERDLLELGRRFPGWHALAVSLGFRPEKIAQPWTFADAGRRVKIMTWEQYRKDFA